MRCNNKVESKHRLIALVGIFENVLGFNAELSTQLVSKTTILDWVLQRIQMKNYDENKGYAAELLSILLQNNRPNRLKLIEKNGVEAILQVLSVCLLCFTIIIPQTVEIDVIDYVAISAKRPS